MELDDKDASEIVLTNESFNKIEENRSSGAERAFVASPNVPQKYLGTDADRRDMTVLGKKQVLRRNFGLITMLAFGSTVICSWEIVLPVFSFSLYNGGPALLFWGFIVITLGMLLVYASLAEMASMSPTAGGQYHWVKVSEFSPPKYQKLLSYYTGWLCGIGWQVFLASVAFEVGGIIQGLIALNNPDYGFERWHATVLTIAVQSLAVVFNTALAVHLPLVEIILLVFHFAGFFAIFIPMWVLAPQSKPQVLTTFVDNGNWGNLGLSAMIALQGPLSSLIGYDCSVHMSEELSDASLQMPKAIMYAVGPNAVLGFLIAVTMVFTVGNVDEVLKTPTYQPFIQVFYNGTGSLVGTDIMCAVVIVCLVACCISEVATASRQLWSFARDNGLPGSRWLTHVNPGWNVPLRAVLVSLLITSLLACINLGSTVALNAINSLGGVAILSSYMMTIGVLIWRRLFGEPLPLRRWTLGRWGLPINIAAFLFLTPLLFFEFWPLARPVTAVSMNWSSTMFAGVLLIATIYYIFRGRHLYSGPVMLVKRVD